MLRGKVKQVEVGKRDSRVIRESLSEEVTSEQRPGGRNKEAMDSLGRGLPEGIASAKALGVGAGGVTAGKPVGLGQSEWRARERRIGGTGVRSGKIL